jgi:1-acyl-sn-glycerol-3-phosphate acyltransferase
MFVVQPGRGMSSSGQQVAAVSESFGARWGRRAITIPVTLCLTAVASVVVPLLLPVFLVVDVVVRRRFGLTRTALFLLCFLWCEVLGIASALVLWVAYIGRSGDNDRRAFVRANSRFQAIWVQTIFSASRFLFQMRITVDGIAPAPGKRAQLVFVRHASTVDTALPIVLLSYPLRYQLRFVLKRELLLDPCVDIVGQRIPNRFVSRGDRTVDEVERVVGLYEDLGPDDAIIIFPEGTRFSPRKRRDLLAQLATRGASPALALAESLKFTLSPLRKGALALLEKNPGCDLLVIAHRGLEGATSFAAFTNGSLVGMDVGIRIFHVPFEELPKDAESQKELLTKLWREVDRFAAGNRREEPETSLKDKHVA